MATKKLYIPTITLDGVNWYKKKDGSITTNMLDEQVQRFATKTVALQHAKTLATIRRKGLWIPPYSITSVDENLVEILVKYHKDKVDNSTRIVAHPHMIDNTDEENEITTSYSLTHGPGYALEINPLNLNDPEYGKDDKHTSHFRRKKTVDKTSNYKGERMGHMTEKDYKHTQKIAKKK